MTPPGVRRPGGVSVSSHRRSRRRWLRWVLVAAAAVVVLAVGVPFVYIHFIEGPAPAPLGLKRHGEPAGAASSPARPGRGRAAGRHLEPSRPGPGRATG